MSALQHVAFIMDGNYRWATNNSSNNYVEAYLKGISVAHKIVDYLLNIKHIPFVTFYALSFDNFHKRSKQKIDFIFDALDSYNNFNNIDYDGRVSYIPIGCDKIIDIFNKKSKISIFNNKNKKCELKVGVAIGYSSRVEVVSVIKNIIQEKHQDISYDTVKKYFYSSFPDPDLVIRTGGMKRMSDFLLLQSAYSELFFTDVLWPDFTVNYLDKIINDFDFIDRKYGG